MIIKLTSSKGNATLRLQVPGNMDADRVREIIKDEKLRWKNTEWKMSCFGELTEEVIPEKDCEVYKNKRCHCINGCSDLMY